MGLCDERVGTVAQGFVEQHRPARALIAEPAPQGSFAESDRGCCVADDGTFARTERLLDHAAKRSWSWGGGIVVIVVLAIISPLLGFPVTMAACGGFSWLSSSRRAAAVARPSARTAAKARAALATSVPRAPRMSAPVHSAPKR